MDDALTFKKDQVYRSLREGMESGRFAAGAKLPGELEFARELGVGKVTLRSALARLESEGLVARIPGKGTFVKGGALARRILIVSIRSEAMELPHNYIIPGIERECAELGFETERCYIEDLRKLTVPEALAVLRARRLRGIVLLTSNCVENDPEIVILRELGLPVVLAHGRYSDRTTGFALLYMNNRQAFMEGLKHLVVKGHRKIGIVGFVNSEKLMRGFSAEELNDVCRELGFAQSDVYSCRSCGPADIRQVVEEMMAKGAPDALMAYSDFFAIELMECLRARGVRVPQDTAVMGFCGYPGGLYLPVPLSTVDFHYEEIGKYAVRLIADSRSWFGVSGVAVPVVAMPFEVVERASTALARYNITENSHEERHFV